MISSLVEAQSSSGWKATQYSMVQLSARKKGTSMPCGEPWMTPGSRPNLPFGNSGWRLLCAHSSSSRRNVS